MTLEPMSVDRAGWERIAQADPRCTLFHTPLWSDLMEKVFPGKVRGATTAFRLGDGAVAVLPLMEVRRHAGLNRSLFSMFPGVYGGPICERSLEAHERLAVARWLIGQGKRVVCLAPPGETGPIPERALDLGLQTHILDLGEPAETFRDRMSHGKRYSLSRAEREGVEVFPAGDAVWWERYEEAYRESLGRWKEPPAVVYPRALFEEMSRLPGGPITLWVAAVRREFAAGAILLYHNQHAVTWHEASFRRFHKTGVNDALHVRILEDCASRGFPAFDFNPSGGHPGVEKYKESFGGVPRRLHAWTWDPTHIRALRRLRDLWPSG